jgi:hypothetical protein
MGVRTSGIGPWIGGVALAFAFGAAACSSGDEETPPPQIASAVAERDVVDGKAKLTSTIEVTFDRDWELAETTLPLASLFEIKAGQADGSTKRILIRTAERSAANTRLVTLTVNDLIPDGATLTIEKKAFAQKAAGTISEAIESELDEASVLLASKALVVTSESFYDEPVTAPVTDADRDAASQRSLLETHFKSRPGAGSESLAAALAVYDGINTETVPSPKLRAAIAALTGTFAEPAITSLLTSDNCTSRPAAKIAFQVPSGNDELVARVTFARGARVVSVNPFAEGERFEHLMPILAHEAIHCDDEDGIVEEVAATAFDGFLYLQLVAVDPELAQARTRVARELNIDAVALINSGQRYPESIGVLPSPGVTAVLPMTSSTAGSFAEFVANAYRSVPNVPSPAENVATAYASILARAAGMETESPFDLVYLDELLSRAVDPGVFANAILAFELTPEG